MEKKQMVHDYCRQFNMAGLTADFDRVLAEAEKRQTGYLDYTLELFRTEAYHREEKKLERQLKASGLPISHDLDTYDHGCLNGLEKSRFSQLRELNWLDRIFNIVFMGPSGTGKSFLAAGLCFDAVRQGYRAYFRTMEQIITTLKMKDFTRSEMADYKRLLKAQLIVIDDIMLFPIEKEQAVSFFNFINRLFEKTAFIITTNKSPKEWAKLLNDEILATALLDRLLFHCEVINLSGKSYRMKNRKTIFKEINQ
jgi:DNA replication protein DnaC